MNNCHKVPVLSFYPLQRCAFTLAEVLITLVVLGVIAALTIPSAINHYRKEQTVNQLKHVF